MDEPSPASSIDSLPCAPLSPRPAAAPSVSTPSGSGSRSPSKPPLPAFNTGRKASVSLQLFKATTQGGPGAGGGVKSDDEGRPVAGSTATGSLTKQPVSRPTRPRLAEAHGSVVGSSAAGSSGAHQVRGAQGAAGGGFPGVSSSRPASPKTTPLAIYSSPNAGSSSFLSSHGPSSPHGGLPTDFDPLGPPAIPLPPTSSTARSSPTKQPRPPPSTSALSPHRQPSTAQARQASSSSEPLSPSTETEEDEPSESSEWSLSSTEIEEDDEHSDDGDDGDEHSSAAEEEDEEQEGDVSGAQDGFEFDLPPLGTGGKLSLSAGVAANARGRQSAVPLEPYSHQVGGHSHIFRFSKRAVCKVSRRL